MSKSVPPPDFSSPPASAPPPYESVEQSQTMQQPIQAPPPSVIILQPPVFGSEPQSITCPHCRCEISTVVEKSPNTKTHLFALLLCLAGLWCCAPCPYYMDTCLAKKHFCSNCKAYLGQYDN